MNIAVTGANGFIGQHVVAELERRSITPVLILRPSSDISLSLSKYVVVPIDLKNPPTNAFDLMGRPDVLMHLAWGGLPNYKSLHHFEEELPAQYRFLKGLVAAGLRSLLVTGTGAEYGMQSGALSEDMATRPQNPYGHAKDTLRCQLEFLRTLQPFALTWARLFYMYGDGQPKGSLLPQLREAVARGDKSFDMSGGEQLRDYLPVAEVARLIVELALRHPDAGIVNVCAGVPISVRRFVEKWIKDNAWDIQLNFGLYPYPDYESMAIWGDRRKLDELLDRTERNCPVGDPLSNRFPVSWPW